VQLLVLAESRPLPLPLPGKGGDPDVGPDRSGVERNSRPVGHISFDAEMENGKCKLFARRTKVCKNSSGQRWSRSRGCGGAGAWQVSGGMRQDAARGRGRQRRSPRADQKRKVPFAQCSARWENESTWTKFYLLIKACECKTLKSFRYNCKVKPGECFPEFQTYAYRMNIYRRNKKKFGQGHLYGFKMFLLKWAKNCFMFSFSIFRKLHFYNP